MVHSMAVEPDQQSEREAEALRARYRASRQLLRQSRDLYDLARLVSDGSDHRADSASLLAKSFYQLVLAVAGCEGIEVASAEDCKRAVTAEPVLEALFG